MNLCSRYSCSSDFTLKYEKSKYIWLHISNSKQVFFQAVTISLNCTVVNPLNISRLMMSYLKY